MTLQTINEINPKAGEVIYCPLNKHHYLKLVSGDIVCMDDKLHTPEQTVLTDSGHWRGWVLITPRPTQEMKLEVGKYYRTRDGRKVGPMELELDGDFMANHPDHGFTVSWHPNGKRYKYDPNIDLITEWTDTYNPEEEVDQLRNERNALQAIIDGDDTPKTWGEMTDVEKGALLLGWQRGGQLQYWDEDNQEWEATDIDPVKFKADAYRIKPEPVVEEVSIGVASTSDGKWYQPGSPGSPTTHRITFTTTDGEPDCDSIKMERIND